MGKRRSEKFFTDEEKKRVSETIATVEAGTIGEVAVMVVDSSDRYREAEFLGGVLLGSLLGVVISALEFHGSVWAFVPLAFLLFFPSRLLYGLVPVLKMAFVGLGRREEAVRERAVHAFYEKGLYRTKQNTGVLFFISLQERKVWVLADSGIYEKIDQDILNGFARSVSQGIRERRACESLCSALRGVGEVLAKHFPTAPGDTNELSDDVLTG